MKSILYLFNFKSLFIPNNWRGIDIHSFSHSLIDSLQALLAALFFQIYCSNYPNLHHDLCNSSIQVAGAQ